MGLSIQQALVVASSGYEKGVVIASVFVYVYMWDGCLLYDHLCFYEH